MEPLIYEVGNGAKLLAIRTDRFKNELLTLQFAVPIASSTAQSYALSMELLRRGTQRYTTKSLLLRHLDDLYATSIIPFNRRLGDLQLLGLTADFLGADFVGGGNGLLPQVIEMMAEMMHAPYMPQGEFYAPYVEAEKSHLRDAIRARINHPRAYARAKCRALLCPKEPYALSLVGEEEDVDALTPKSLTAAWRELLGGVTPLFFYVGKNDPCEVAQLLSDSFAWLGGDTLLPQTLFKMPCGVKREEEQMPLCQGKLCVGYRTDISLSHPLAAAMAVLNEIFGGSAASKLFLNVREKRSLCYHCSSSLDLYKGVLFAEAGMRVENRVAAENAVRGEFKAILRGDIGDLELHAAKSALDHSHRQLSDLPSSLADFYLRRFIVGNGDSAEQCRARIAAVTRAEVAQAAEHLREGAVFFLNGTLGAREGEDI